MLATAASIIAPARCLLWGRNYPTGWGSSSWASNLIHLSFCALWLGSITKFFHPKKTRICPGGTLQSTYKAIGLLFLCLAAFIRYQRDLNLSYGLDCQPASRTTCLTSSLGTLASLTTSRREFVGADRIWCFRPPMTWGVRVVFVRFLGIFQQQVAGKLLKPCCGSFPGPPRTP